MHTRAWWVAIVSCLFALLVAPAAHATPTSTFSPNATPGGGTLVVTGDGAAETFTLSSAEGGVEVAGPAGINDPDGAGTHCTASGGTVRCDITDTDNGSVVVNGGAGNDTLIENRGADEERDTLNGDGGDDTLLLSVGTVGHFLHTSLNGGAGNDTLTRNGDDFAGPYLDGGSGDDTLNAGTGTLYEAGFGGAGNDTFNGSAQYMDFFVSEPGDDTYHGGTRVPEPGEVVADPATYQFDRAPDWIDYGGRTVAQTVSLDGTANDGSRGERDNVGTDVEILTGGSGADTLTAGGSTARLSGEGGNDTLSGSPSHDRLGGGPGDDAVFGNDGNDIVTGGTGEDRLTGGAGDDDVFGDQGHDILAGGGGDDHLSGFEDNDILAGGAGDDRLDGAGGDDRLAGNAGQDILDDGDFTQPIIGQSSDQPAPGRDQLDGGAGNDYLRTDRGADDIRGGTGGDTASFSRPVPQAPTVTTPIREAAFEISLDNRANDGARGESEGDNAHSDIEEIDTRGYFVGGDDVVTGTAHPERFFTGDGNDTITPRSGSDVVFAGPGMDTINAVDHAADRIDCGADHDHAIVDLLRPKPALNDSTMQCETITSAP